MKKICKKYKIPTANFKICKNKNDFKNSIDKFRLPIVVKADGLAAGKGVVICKLRKKHLKFLIKYLKVSLKVLIKSF